MAHRLVIRSCPGCVSGLRSNRLALSLKSLQNHCLDQMDQGRQVSWKGSNSQNPPIISGRGRKVRFIVARITNPDNGPIRKGGG